MTMVNVLVLGSGAREHAMVWKLRQSPLLGSIYVSPGNAGTAPYNCSAFESNDELVHFCRKNDVGLTIVGSEDLLADGIVDYLNKSGVPAFGPCKSAARIESDKAFTRHLCAAMDIPSPHYKVFDNFAAVECYLAGHDGTIVLKDSFLAAGKGVIISDNHECVRDFARDIFARGMPEQTVVVEEYLNGREISAFILCDGDNLLFFGDAQDYKRIGNNNTGCNTGGMGAISPAPGMNELLREEIIVKFARPAVEYLSRCGIKYVGVLFLGLILVDGELKLLEFNARFGDPETQSLLPRIENDFLELLLATVNGKLGSLKVSATQVYSTCVVMVSDGYPGTYEKGTIISYIPSDALVFHSSTKFDDNNLLAMGGRSLSVVALGSSATTSRDIAYDAVDRTIWSNGYYRRDIGY